MERNNEERLGLSAERSSSIVENTNKRELDFAIPTEFVDLPSGGKHYPKGHPLHGVESVEIKYMTAKEEDILTSRSLLRTGTVIDRLIEAVIVSHKVRAEDMLTGDREAVLVASRITGYGSAYETKVKCPACEASNDYSFDLNQISTRKGGDNEKATTTPNGTWLITLPMSKWEVEVRLLTGADEKKLANIVTASGGNKGDHAVSDQLRLLIVSIEGHTDRETLNKAIDSLPASDTRMLKEVYSSLAPGVDATQDYVCPECGFQTTMEVPFDTAFFWPK
jgi:hypothetical protein